MNKLIYFFIGILALLNCCFGHPSYRKEFDKIINSNDCLKLCMSNLTTFDEEISLMKNPNLQRYFGKYDEICGIILSTRQCIDKCEIESNPFALESVNVICLPKIKEKVEKIRPCLNETKIDIYDACVGSCGADYNSVNDQVHRLTQAIKEDELKDSSKVDPIMEKTNEACGIYKCATKCNIEVVKNECGKEIASELQSILQQIFDAHFNDLKKLNLVEKMSKSVSPQCNYMYDPTAIFGAENGSQNVPDILIPQDVLSRLQFDLLIKQLKLAEKQEKLIERENEKLDMEIDLISQKFNQKQTKNFEESRFIFN
jgi:hypothetical protein